MTGYCVSIRGQDELVNEDPQQEPGEELSRSKNSRRAKALGQERGLQPGVEKKQGQDGTSASMDILRVLEFF